MNVDVAIAGGGPGGLAAAEVLAQRGIDVVLCEQNPEIGSPTHTSAGTFIDDVMALGIPAEMYNPITICRFLSPRNEASFSYKTAVTCVMDVHRVYQFLAERAAGAGARLLVATRVTSPVLADGRVTGIEVLTNRKQRETISSRILIDASGYKAEISKKAGLHPGFSRFGVGAEYDLHAPDFDEREAVLIVGSQIAPSGYAWAFPYGRHRVRLGVGIIHPDSQINPADYLDNLLANEATFHLNLKHAQPIEYHYGLIPSEGMSETMVGHGIMAVGDAAGQPSALVGEGIRWAMWGGRMAADVAADALAAGDVSAAGLAAYEREWRKKYGWTLSVAHAVNKRMAAWSDDKWDQRVDLLKKLTPAQFANAMRSNFFGAWVIGVALTNPSLIGKIATTLAGRVMGAGKAGK